MSMELPDNRKNVPARTPESERALELLRVWRERTPVVLKSSSAIRKNGLIEKAGFNPDNIRVIVSPDSAEENVFETASADSRLAEACAVAKGESSETVPPEAIVFAFDTLVVWYPECAVPAHPENVESWLGASIRKPKSIVEAKETTKRLFLGVLTNHANFRAYEKKTGMSEGGHADDRDEYAKQDFASGIHAVTSLDVRFPYSESAETYRDRIIARPQRLYGLIADSDMDAERMTPEAVSFRKCGDGRTVDEALDEIIEQVFKRMEESGVDPLKICGGVAYSDAGVRELLGITETADVCPDGLKSAVPDRSIYSGYPETLVRNVLNRRAYEIANSVKR
jgi:hypothetical protein